MNSLDDYIKVIFCVIALLFIAVFILGKKNKQTVRYLAGFNILVAFSAVVLFVYNLLMAATSADYTLFVVVIIIELLAGFLSIHVFRTRGGGTSLKFMTYFVFAVHFLIVLLFLIFMFTFKMTRLI